MLKDHGISRSMSGKGGCLTSLAGTKTAMMECPVWAAEDLLMIHTTESGRRTIRLRRPAKLRTLLGNPVPERECTEFEYEFSGPETILVQLDKPSEFEDDFR